MKNGARKWLAALLGLAGAAAVYALWRAADADRKRRKIAPGQKIVIVGAGFAGIYAAHELTRLLPTHDDREIILIDRNDYLLFTPMLTEAAGGMVGLRHIVRRIHPLASGIRFEQGDVSAINLKAQRVTLTDGRTFDADQLLLALGSVPEYHGIPGLEAHSRSVKTLDDAAQIHAAARALLSRADAEPDARKRRDLLTVVVGGAGYTGVETMAAVNDLMRDELRRFPRLSASDLQMILVDLAPRLLPELSENLAHYAERTLTARGVQLRLKTPVTAAGEGWVEFNHDERHDVGLLLWAGGFKPAPVVAQADGPHGRGGGLIVDETCAVPGFPGVWAVGDNAQIPQPGQKKPYAKTAQNATRAGIVVAQNIAATLCGDRPKPFVYTPIGELALVGKRAGVASVYGLPFSGLLAWALWRMVYLAKMPGWKQRFGLLGDYVEDALSDESPAAGRDD